MIKQILLVGLGGALGSILRYLTSIFTAKHYSGSFPLSTFVVNIIGCFLIGLLIGLLDQNSQANQNLKLLFITGFCGGFTTFSAFSFENFTFLQSGNYSIFAIYSLSSFALCLLAVFGGFSLVKVF